MNQKQVYYYHIITSADIAEEIKSKQTYPIVHFQDETCYDKCGLRRGDSEQPTEEVSGCSDGNILSGTRTETGNGRDGNIRLESDTGRTGPQLCAGTEGVGIVEGDGGYRVRWGNGRTRRYSNGGGSSDRPNRHSEHVEGSIYPVGSYIANNENEVSAIYNGPYKLIALLQGTRRRLWHLIYISANKQWGFNSRLGRIIREGAYKTSSINCMSCLREYLYSGNGRQILQDILSDEHIEACKCAGHSCGMVGYDQWATQNYEAECTEGGDSIFRNEGSTSQEGEQGVVDATSETDECSIRKRLWNGNKVPCKNGQVLCGRKNSDNQHDNRKDRTSYERNTDIILLLCKNSAFTESEAMEVLTRTPEGIEFICTKQYTKRIKNYIHIARILVFQESIKQRFERAKTKFELDHPEMMTDEYQDTSFKTLMSILRSNDIDMALFAEKTFKHLQGKTGKKNNLFFFGKPSTGKTMIMTALVECQFNFYRLTRLTPNSSFNFSNLLHSNACFMDECKLTENQFEQWKLLASGMPMSTDVKYKDRCDIKKCILYTCSNYPIEMYCKVPMAKDAIQERTITFTFNVQLKEYTTISPFCWEKLWNLYNFNL